MTAGKSTPQSDLSWVIDSLLQLATASEWWKGLDHLTATVVIRGKGKSFNQKSTANIAASSSSSTDTATSSFTGTVDTTANCTFGGLVDAACTLEASVIPFGMAIQAVGMRLHIVLSSDPSFCGVRCYHS